MTLGGNVVIRNGVEYDFCWREAIQSLLPVCDKVVVCDGESTDGTQEEIREWMKREPKLVLCVYPWPHPKGDIDFFVKWINYAREHVPCDWQFQLDADEILHEKSYPEVLRFIKTPGRAARITRWNFWKDVKHTIPDGVCLAKQVNRIAPQNIWMASDGPHPMGAPISQMAVETGIEIFHYGYLRHRKAFFAEKRSLQDMFFASYDKRLEDAEQTKGNWMEEIKEVEWVNRLDSYSGDHPALIKDWLKQRGHKV